MNHLVKKYFLAFVVLVWLAGCSQSGAPVKIGIINSISSAEPAVTGFMAALAEIGYLEGQTVVYQYAGVLADTDQIAAQVQYLLEHDVDLIFTLTTSAAQTVHATSAGTNIPVVFAAVGDPVAAGLVQNLRSPGGNFTGVLATNDPIDAAIRRLELLTLADPTIRTVWVPYQEDERITPAVTALETIAPDLGVELVLTAANTSEAVETRLTTIPPHIDAIYYVGGRAYVGYTNAFIQTALDVGLPISVNYCTGPQDGALMAYCSDFYAAGRQAARLADLILKGESPANLPVETPGQSIIVNLKTAEAIGLTLTDDFLLQADEIIRE